MSTFCSNCGSALPPSARFCSVCGTTVTGFPGAGMPGAGFPPGFSPYYPRLVRPLFGRQFAGVCAGLARTYGWDVGLIRILTVVGGIFLCPIVEILYLACWIGIPEEPIGEMPPPPPPMG
jgi:phage shock protein C